MAVGGDVELERGHRAAGPKGGDDGAACPTVGVAQHVAAAKDLVAVSAQHLFCPAAEQLGRSLVPEDDPVAAVRGKGRRVSGSQQVEDLRQTLRAQFRRGGNAIVQSLRAGSPVVLHL
jgi:hypothetical protein